MDIRQLRAIRAVIETGGIGRAATSLHVSQPALTKTIQRLERELGVALFDRNGRRLQPTPFAHRLFEHARSVESALDQASAELKWLKAGTMGSVTIGASPLTASKVLPEGIARTIGKHPTLTVNVVTVTSDLTEGLLAGHFDFVVKVLGSEDERIVKHATLFKDRLLVVCGRDHPLFGRRKLAPRELANYPWVLPPAGNLHRVRLDQYFAAEGLPAPRIAVECSNTGVIVDVVRRTNCLGIVARIALPDETSNEVKELPVPSPFFIRAIGLAWRRGGRLSPAAQVVMDEIAKCYRTAGMGPKPVPNARSIAGRRSHRQADHSTS